MGYKKIRKQVTKNIVKPLVKRYRKRYIGKSGGLKVQKMAKDITYLKSVLNPEKKTFQFTWQDANVGQCNVNNNGLFCQDITPIPAQGITSITRNGNSIRLHTAYLKMQAQAQSSSIGPRILTHVYIIQVIGQPITSANLPGLMFKNNPFITGGSIIDYNSDRREDTFKQFRILRKISINLYPNQHTGQFAINTKGSGIRFKSHHVKFSTDGLQTVADGQLFLLALSDNGNVGASTSTLAGTSTTTSSTGLNLQIDLSYWFYDN